MVCGMRHHKYLSCCNLPELTSLKWVYFILLVFNYFYTMCCTFKWNIPVRIAYTENTKNRLSDSLVLECKQGAACKQDVWGGCSSTTGFGVF